MCRTTADGGARCAPSMTTNTRRVVAQRLKRHTASGDTVKAARDVEVLAGLDAGRAHYGDVVTPMNMVLPDSVHEVFAVIRAAGLRPMIVGGSVRDALSDGRAPKDIDIEVYGATIDEVTGVLGEHYRVDEVGRAFGVLKAVLPDGTDLDVSVPRRDNHVGAGHRGFTVETDVSMNAAEAAARRDFTINAMGYDPEFKVCVDPYHGRTDLEAGVLRATSEAFAEDPLRVLRGFQFAARYGMTLDDDTATECASLVGRSDELAVERVRSEWGKFYTKGEHAAHGLGVLAASGWDVTVPGLREVDSPEFRARVGAAAVLASGEGLPADARERLVAATMAHAMTSEQAHAFIEHTVDGGDQQRAAYALSRAVFASGSSDADVNVRNFAAVLGTRTSVREWARLATVTGDPVEAARVLGDAERLGCADGPQPDFLLGRDIVARFPGRRPGPWTGDVQRAARQAQTDGVFVSRAEAEAWLVSVPDPA